VAEPSIVVPAHSEYIAQGCPTCHRGIEEGQTIVLCTRCRVPHHENCWYDKGGCGRVGCRGVATARSDKLGVPGSKAGEALEEIKPVHDPRSSQLPIPIVLAIGTIVLIVAYYLFMR
jgi:hypothetical protein